MKKIIIIGANSYIARNLIFFIKRDFGEEVNLRLYGHSESQVDGFDSYSKISNEDLSTIDLGGDLIYVFAGKTGSANGFSEFDEFIEANERFLLKLLNEHKRQDSKGKIIFPSTRLVYKGREGALLEDDEKEFKTVYAINKFACETYLEQFHRVYGIDYCIFRICVPYGSLIPGASSYGTTQFMINRAASGEKISLYGDGSVRRTLTHIEDLCRGLFLGAENKSCVNTVYNIGGEDYSLKEMAELIAEKYGTGVDFVPWPEVEEKIESGSTVFEDKKLKAVLGDYIQHKFKGWVEQLT